MGMSGGGGKSRATLSEINITPLVDVMLVLLIMFMVTTPLMQQGIEVDLPKTSSSGVEVNEEPFVLVINSDQRMTIAKQKIAMNELRPKLKAIFENKKNKQVYIQADRKVDYGFVAEAMAEVRAAGIFNIGLITQPKDQ
ncbi:biopolymer transporter ExbD [Bdellovibrio bacteriovorus]|uniref:Adventurous gliding motility protein V n=1 Tax=Bdellovibrio bacteriovorus (strain ATCC 15356 / DSM 50701 / NCIMB 9529 / HD100) TaxID=264462 RepID=Q6MRB0_BDEBA|nr:biopolymer transporter ExbD [Bdellovibrio bacteriovorus]AHZ85824.1 biopolymer transporter ExbD [Bdellovibrio bacteriovorus]BEV66744.1 Biopolymer transport protein ExbD [Bdellovibrio bacteriovorus]CAE77848.1 Adventurous gliding motility protein V [Bdellovibrio bacteriovorus HD100]